MEGQRLQDVPRDLPDDLRIIDNEAGFMVGTPSTLVIALQT
jgi:hypothetical protein